MLLNILWCTGQPLTTEDPSLQNVNSATAGKPCLDPCSQVPSLFPGNIILNELVLNIFLLSEAWFQQHSSNQLFTFFLSNPKMWSSVLLLRNKGCCVNQRGRIILALPFHLLLAFPSPSPDHDCLSEIQNELRPVTYWALPSQGSHFLGCSLPYGVSRGC